MKKIKLFFSAVVLLVGMATTSSFITAPPPGPSANGQGTVTAFDATRHFSFHVNTMPNATVKGSGVLTYTAGGVKIKFDITCLTVVGNEARMSGIITSHSTVPGFVGTGCRFVVIDNGEGNNAAADQISLLNYGFATQPPCDEILLDVYDIEGGNIQVKN